MQCWSLLLASKYGKPGVSKIIMCELSICFAFLFLFSVRCSVHNMLPMAKLA